MDDRGPSFKKLSKYCSAGGGKEEEDEACADKRVRIQPATSCMKQRRMDGTEVRGGRAWAFDVEDRGVRLPMVSLSDRVQASVGYEDSVLSGLVKDKNRSNSKKPIPTYDSGQIRREVDLVGRERGSSPCCGEFFRSGGKN